MDGHTFFLWKSGVLRDDEKEQGSLTSIPSENGLRPEQRQLSERAVGSSGMLFLDGWLLDLVFGMLQNF
jgi:hypothetical protein